MLSSRPRSPNSMLSPTWKRALPRASCGAAEGECAAWLSGLSASISTTSARPGSWQRRPPHPGQLATAADASREARMEERPGSGRRTRRRQRARRWHRRGSVIRHPSAQPHAVGALAVAMVKPARLAALMPHSRCSCADDTGRRGKRPRSTPGLGSPRGTRRTACTTDAQCAVLDSTLVGAEACCPGCTWHAGEKLSVAAFKAACEATPAPMCPPVGCAMAVVTPACVAGTCVAK